MLESKTNNPWCVIKEVTNSISAGIYISHGHSSIYGSDIHDWVKYEELSASFLIFGFPSIVLSIFACC